MPCIRLSSRRSGLRCGRVGCARRRLLGQLGFQLLPERGEGGVRDRSKPLPGFSGFAGQQIHPCQVQAHALALDFVAGQVQRMLPRGEEFVGAQRACLLYTSPSPRD